MDNQNSEKCELCKVTFNSVKDMTSHYQGKKHVKLREQYRDVTCGIFITGFTVGKTKEELLHYFSKFGDIIRTHIGPKLNYIIIIYENESDAKTVVDHPHYIDGKKLIVEKRTPPMKPAIAGPQEIPDEETTQMLKKLQDISKLNVQINKFILMTTPNIPQMIPIYHRVNIDMLETMRCAFSHCEVFPFGSTTTSLQFKNSDIDIFVHIRHRPEDDVECLKEAKKALHRGKLFRNILGIPAAKIPIVRCIHSETGIKCDVSFRNMLGVKNSQLISYYLSLDSKLRTVMLIIKYWAKIQGISGRNHLFTNYSIVMMFIFYLQRKFSCPSVLTLQQKTQPAEPGVIWNINVSQTHSHAKMCKSKSASTLAVLKGFFSFYSEFPYDTHIICPYLGDSLEKQMFSKLDTIQDEFSLYKTHIETIEMLKYDRAICLQDPFEHNINICSIIFPNILEKFITLCKMACEILSEKTERNMLYDLFSKRPIEKIVQSSPPDPENYLICIKMQNNSNYLSREMKLSPDDQNYKKELINFWFREVYNYVHTVFEKVLKLTLIQIVPSSKNSRLDNQKDVHDFVDCEKYRASCFMNLWETRKVSTPEIDDELAKCETTLAQNILISDYLWKRDTDFRPSTSLFECELNLTCLEDPARVNVELVRISSYKKVYKAFCRYIIVKLPQWFEVYENEMSIKV